MSNLRQGQWITQYKCEKYCNDSFLFECLLFCNNFFMLWVISGDVARLNGQLVVSRAFRDKNLKMHLRSDPDIHYTDITPDVELLILASDGLWKVFDYSLFVYFFVKAKLHFSFLNFIVVFCVLQLILFHFYSKIFLWSQSLSLVPTII